MSEDGELDGRDLQRAIGALNAFLVDIGTTGFALECLCQALAERDPGILRDAHAIAARTADDIEQATDVDAITHVSARNAEVLLGRLARNEPDRSASGRSGLS